MSDKRKQAMAALDAALRALNGIDEIEAEDKAQRRALEATTAELEQEKSRLASTNAAITEAEAAHQKWREVTERERLKGNAAIDALQAELQSLEAAVTEKRHEHANIVSGLQALRARLRV